MHLLDLDATEQLHVVVDRNRLEVRYVGDYSFAGVALLLPPGFWGGSLVIAKDEVLKVSIGFRKTAWLLYGFNYLQIGMCVLLVQGALLLDLLKSFADFFFKRRGKIRCF